MAVHFYTGSLALHGAFFGTERLPVDLDAGGSDYMTGQQLVNAAARVYYGVDSGAADALVVSLSAANPTTQAQLLGVVLNVLVNNTNLTQTPTLNVAGLGAQLIVTRGVGGAAGVSVGGLAQNKICQFIWDGTNYQYLGRVATASQAMIEAGTDFISPITSLGLRSAMAFITGATTGYQVLPTGVIFQWGTFTTVTGINDALTFPITFPNAVVSFVATATVVGAPMVSFVGSGGITTSGVALGTGQLTAFPLPASGAGVPVRWIAVGH